MYGEFDTLQLSPLDGTRGKRAIYRFNEATAECKIFR